MSTYNLLQKISQKMDFIDTKISYLSHEINNLKKETHIENEHVHMFVQNEKDKQEKQKKPEKQERQEKQEKPEKPERQDEHTKTKNTHAKLCEKEIHHNKEEPVKKTVQNNYGRLKTKPLETNTTNTTTHKAPMTIRNSTPVSKLHVNATETATAISMDFETVPSAIPHAPIGIIFTRKITTTQTNAYWNENILQIRTFTQIPIVIIDDASDATLVKTEPAITQLNNIYVVKVEHHLHGRGELLPYYYWHTHQWFNKALITHDSVFIQKNINFSLIKQQAIPLWHFVPDSENRHQINAYLHQLTNSSKLMQLYNTSHTNMMNGRKKWYGCFGVQSFMTLTFLNHIVNKYKLFKLLHVVKKRRDRCCMERVMGLIISAETNGTQFPLSIAGNIQVIGNWGYRFKEYMHDKHHKKRSHKNFIKVWTGR